MIIPGVLAGAALVGLPPDPHRYWRIYITAGGDGGQSHVSFGELEMAETLLGPNVCDGGTPLASSQYSASYTVAQAFDGSLITLPWHAANGSSPPQWVRYDFGAGNERDINEVRISARQSTWANQAPGDFSIQFSDDGVTWTEKWAVTGEGGWTGYEVRRFQNPAARMPKYTGSVHGAHLYWRTTMLTAGSLVQYAEQEFRAVPDGADQATGGTATASSQNSTPLWAVGNAFDGDPSSGWASSDNVPEAWVQYQFPAPVEVSGVNILPLNGFAYHQTRTPERMAVQYSDDGSHWSIAWFEMGVPQWSSGDPVGNPSDRLFLDPYYIGPPFNIEPPIIYDVEEQVL